MPTAWMPLSYVPAGATNVTLPAARQHRGGDAVAEAAPFLPKKREAKNPLLPEPTR